jgi:regulatory protein
VRRISEQSVANAALFYLRRYAASRKRLTQVLVRKVKRVKGGSLEDGLRVIDVVVERMARAGYIDDERLAAATAASLHRQGKSVRMIGLKLRLKGLPQLKLDRAQDLEAAQTLVRRRKLGPDDLAVLARAGFSFDVAKRALGITGFPPRRDARRSGSPRTRGTLR